MQIILNDANLHKILEKSVDILGRGGMIVYPSDTVYGIAVDATNSQALQNLADFKGRTANQKFSYNFADVAMIQKFCEVSDEQLTILKEYLPGPYTFIIQPDISVRVPRDSIITEITRAYGKPTSATSANLTGKAPATSIKNLDSRIYLKADLLIESTEFTAQKPSTIVDISKQPYEVLREGELPFPRKI